MKTSIHQFNILEHECFVLNDFSNTHTADELIVNPNIEELEQLSQEFSFTLDKIPVDYNNLLIKTGDQLVLVDTGIPRPMGNLFPALEELGHNPEDIDLIVITHSDMDHIGGILDEQGGISFPNASYIILKDVWQYWTSEETRAELESLNKWPEGRIQVAWDIYSKIENRIKVVKSGEEFIPGLSLVPATGHRYDHSILKITSSNELLVHLSDALAHPLFIAKPDWYSTYDANPTQAVKTKEELLNMCAEENALVFGAHFPFPGLGYIQKEGEKLRCQPVD